MTVKNRIAAFLDGVGSTVDIFAVRGPGSMEILRGQAADGEALGGDWRRVGDDIRTAMARQDAARPATPGPERQTSPRP